ncbi:unnamed protein product [Allacma fusca]|uniref:GST C-terminal domain-containing protein n=1 Tax=Allacma fusca TaxID=39272 RepID=A0A8J2PIH4_9HEXA|nr:unnamed protein product [Allacma fusca]
MLHNTCTGIRNFFKSHFRIQDEQKRAEGFKDSAAVAKLRFLSKFDEIAEANGGYLVGSGLTWADIVTVFYIHQIRKLTQIDPISDLPGLARLLSSVSNAEGIKQRFATLSGRSM